MSLLPMSVQTPLVRTGPRAACPVRRTAIVPLKVRTQPLGLGSFVARVAVCLLGLYVLCFHGCCDIAVLSQKPTLPPLQIPPNYQGIFRLCRVVIAGCSKAPNAREFPRKRVLVPQLSFFLSPCIVLCAAELYNLLQLRLHFPHSTPSLSRTQAKPSISSNPLLLSQLP